VQSCANPVIYSFMSNSFRRRVRAGWHQCRCCFRRGDHGGLSVRDSRDVHYGDVEDHRLEELGADGDASATRLRVSFGNQSARRWSSMTAASSNSRRKTGVTTRLSVMTG